MFQNTVSLSKFAALCESANHELPYPVEEQIEQSGHGLANELLDLVLGTGLEDHTVLIMECFINGLHTAVRRLDKDHGKAVDEMRSLERENFGSEITDYQLQEATTKARRLKVTMTTMEILRDATVDMYATSTGNTWVPYTGSAKNAATTATMYEAREVIRAHDIERRAPVPSAHVVVIRADKDTKTVTDATRVFDALNAALERWPDMQLATTGNYGAEQTALKWAAPHVKAGRMRAPIIAKLDRDQYGFSAPFKANEQLIALKPVHVFTLAKSLENTNADHKGFGPALNMKDLADKNGIVHQAITAKAKPAAVTA